MVSSWQHFCTCCAGLGSTLSVDMSTELWALALGVLPPAPPDSKQQISHLTECPLFQVRFGVSFQPVSPYSSLDMKA